MIKTFKISIILIILAGVISMQPAELSQDKRPNFIFIIADDMTTNMFNFLPEGKGKNLTPSLDRLSEEGMIMMGQYVCSTVCTPSRFNTLTGLYASRATNPEFCRQTSKNENQRVVEWNTHIMPGEPNIASILKEAGYLTGAVGKNHVIEVKGWKEVKLTDDANDSRVMKIQKSNYEKTIQAYNDCGFDFADGIYYENPDFNGPRALAVHNLDWSTQAALKFLDMTGDKPFFLYFATTLPHGPQEAKRAWNADRRITPIGILDEAPDVLPDKSTIPLRLKQAEIPLKDPKANLLWMDDALSVILDKLESQGLAENTYIFFFNDHGQYGKGSIYQGAVHDPSIVWKQGGLEGGHTSKASILNIDFAPTIMELAGLKPEKYEFDGKSFAQVLKGEEQVSRESMYFEIGYSRGVQKGRYKYIALRYPEWVTRLTLDEREQILEDYNKKLAIRGKSPNNLDPAEPFGHVQIIPGGGDAEYNATQRYPHYSDPDQLYDLHEDPDEEHNLFDDPDYAGVVKDLKEELMKYINTIPGKFGEFKK